MVILFDSKFSLWHISMAESNLQNILPETETSQPYLPESTSKQLCYLPKRGADCPQGLLELWVKHNKKQMDHKCTQFPNSAEKERAVGRL